MEKVGKILGGGLVNRVAPSERATRLGQPSCEGSMRPAQVVVHRTTVADIATGIASQEEQTAQEGARTSPAHSRRRPRLGARTDLTKVRGILSKVLAYRGLDKKVERYEFILHWHEIVGERLAEVSKPEYIRDKALVVQVLHPAWAQELTMIKPVLLESLARYLKPGDIVRDMVFRVGTF